MGVVSKKVGKRIKEIRELRGIKQCALADILNMEPSNLTRIESGYQFPKEENLLKIAQNLGVEIKDLFDFSGEAQKEILLNDIYDILKKLDTEKINFIYKFIKLFINTKI